MTLETRASAPMRRAVVTGSTGFVGRHLARRLAVTGVEVTGLSRSSGFDVLEDEMPLDGVDHVFHLAGATFVPKSWTEPATFHQINAHGTVRMLDQCRRAGVPMTYVSAYVYGIPRALPIAETAPADANNPYAFSKLAGETACRFFAKAYNFPVGIVRLFNVYGPGQEPSFLIPTIARQVVDPATTEIVVASLAPRRDFVYIDDVAEALLLAPHLPSGTPFNVGSGRSWSVEDIIRACLCAARSLKPIRDRGETRNNEIMDVVADIGAIERAVGWRPATDFESGIAAVVESVRS